jgi:hypothetical protein
VRGLTVSDKRQWEVKMDLERIEALERLAELNRQGFLTDAEVALEKNRILSSEVPTVDESGSSHEPPPPLIDLPARLRELREKSEAVRELREEAEAESEHAANKGPQPLHPTAEAESEENQILSSEVPTVDESGSSHEPHPPPVVRPSIRIRAQRSNLIRRRLLGHLT